MTHYSALTIDSPQEERSEALRFYIKEAFIYNRWRRRALKVLLGKVAPALAQRSHYYEIKELSKALDMLSLSWQPCMNHISKQWDRYMDTSIAQILVDGLCQTVFEPR